MESNNLLAGDVKRVLVRKTRLHLIANLHAPPPPPPTPSPLYSVISVSDSSAHFVAEFLHCSVNSRRSLQPWDTPSRHPRLKTEPIGHTSRGALYDCVSWFKLFSFPLHYNEVEKELETLILQSECTDMYLKRFLGISKYTRNHFFRINL